MFGQTLEELQDYLGSLGEPKFRANQIWHWVYKRGVTDISRMTNLSAAFREKYSYLLPLEVLQEQKVENSADGETTKFLWQLGDRSFIESVLIRAPGRRTVCVSSQVGCPARCAFCASGRQGLVRNLSAAEIVEQVYQIDRYLQESEERVSHIVYMGMGEPLENYDEVVKSIRIFNETEGLRISQRRITVSTVGVIPGIIRFSEEGLQVSLVLSLHAPNQKLRQKIVPYARKFVLEELLSVMRDFHLKTGRNITYEYTLLAGINDQPEHAEELVTLLKEDQCVVNLIPYNPIDGLRLKRPDRNVIDKFQAILLRGGIQATQRYTKGKDIAAACGQLSMKEPRNEMAPHAISKQLRVLTI
jgi:23S rRNA (adenine2503-C2)-methyltransferase